MLTGDICTFLAATTALGLTAGTNLFSVAFPEASPDQSVAIIETPGQEDEHGAGASKSRPLYEVARFQVVCRDVEANAVTCNDLARSIRLNLNRVADTTMTGTLVLTCKSLQRPFPLPGDDNNRVRVITNYEATIRDIAST